MKQKDKTMKNTEDNILRKVRLAPYLDQTRAFILTTFDQNRTDSLGKNIIGYTFEKEGETDPIFEETELCCSPMHAIDSDEALRSCLTFICLRPGDTDPDYFENYTDRQRAFCDDDAEMLSTYSLEGSTETPYDEDLLADDDEDQDEEEDQDDEPHEPEEGDITTEDHARFYQYGKLWLEIDKDEASNEMRAAIRAKMDQDQFWPNVWFISDHGNAHPMSVQPEEGEKMPTKAQADAVEPLNGRAEFVTAMTDLIHFMSRQQWQFVKQLACGEEKQFFYDKMVELANLIAGMPQTYDQDGAGDNAFAYLHYFKGGCDWYITEKDKGSDDDEPQDRGKQHQAFGLANLGYGPELGYISIQELLDNNVELDFHFSPKTIATIKGRDSIVAVNEAGAVHGVGAAV